MQWYSFQRQRSRDYPWHKLTSGNFIVEFQVKELDENGRQNELDENGRRKGMAGLEGRGGEDRVRDYEKLPSFQDARVLCGSSSTFLWVIERGTRLDIIRVQVS